MVTITRAQLSILFRYCLVGTSGTILDLGILYALVEYAHLPVIPASIISFVIAAFNNFLWNKIWTFQDRSARVIKQYIKFMIVSVMGLLLNTSILFVAVHLLLIWYVAAKLFASGVILLWNFAINKFWTFRSYAIPQPENNEAPSCDLSIIIPAYNEEAVLKTTLTAVFEYCSKHDRSYEVIIVDDGSTDTTPTVAQTFCNQSSAFHTLTHSTNLGKGASVHDGMLAATGSVIIFMDADSATPIATLDTFMPWFEKGFDIVIGSRYLPTSTILLAQPWYRVLLGRIGNLFIQLLLLEGVVDTQCGFKAFTFKAARAVAPRQCVTGWGFDMELLAIGRQMGFRIAEVPVEWKNSTVRSSRFRPIRDAHRTLKDLFVIKMNLMTKKYHS